jgi:RNA recognition motif-containing protein
MYDLFSKYGALKKIAFPFDRYMRRPKGFAFVEYEERKDAEDAFDYFNGREVEGRQLRCDWDSGKRVEGRVSSRDYDHSKGGSRDTGAWYPPSSLPYRHPPYSYGPYSTAYYPPPPPPSSSTMSGRERNNPVTRDPNYREPPYERKSEGGMNQGDEPRRRVYMA